MSPVVRPGLLEDNRSSLQKEDGNMRSPRRAVTVVLVLGLALWCAGAAAQTNSEINAGIQFNFSSPGARSLAFGGAFVGLADDATAAYTNPAGLTNLSLPEVAFEGRSWDYTTTFVDYGNASGQATAGAHCQNGVGDCIDGVVMGESSKSTSGLSFLSVAYAKGNWAIAVYRHELAHFRASFEDQSKQGIFFNVSGSTVPGRYYPITAETELDVVNYGFSGALRVSRSFSLGLGVSYYDLGLDSLTTRYKVSDTQGFAPGEYYGLPLRENNTRNTVTEKGDDTAIGVSVGLLVRATDSLSLGVVYRQGPKFDCTSTAVRLDPAGDTTTLETVLHVPDVIGLGVAYRLSDRATLSFDYDFVRYSQLTEDIKDPYSGADLDDYVVDDGNELHLGFEYLFLSQKVIIPVRLGVWQDPDHKIRYEGDFDAERARFSGGDDEVHYTAGIGVAVGTPFELNIAYDHSDTVKTASLSAVIRFK